MFASASDRKRSLAFARESLSVFAFACECLSIFTFSTTFSFWSINNLHTKVLKEGRSIVGLRKEHINSWLSGISLG